MQTNMIGAISESQRSEVTSLRDMEEETKKTKPTKEVVIDTLQILDKSDIKVEEELEISINPAFSGVLHPCLRVSSFYTPDRVLRQFGFQQIPWTLYDEMPSKVLMLDDFREALTYAWDHKTMIRPVAETAHTICLPDVYLDFYTEKVNPNYRLFDKFRMSVLQGVYEYAMKKIKIGKQILGNQGDELINFFKKSINIFG